MRAGGFLFCVWRLKGFTVCLPPAHNYPAGANIVRPQHDRSLCRERPRTRLTITREHTVLPYGYAFADEFTNGAPRSYPRAPSLAAAPQFTLAHPTVYISYGDIAMRRRLNHSVHSPFSIFHPPFSILHYSEKKNSVPLYPSGTL